MNDSVRFYDSQNLDEMSDNLPISAYDPNWADDSAPCDAWQQRLDTADLEATMGEFFAMRAGLEIRGEISAEENRRFFERYGFGHLAEDAKEGK